MIGRQLHYLLWSRVNGPTVNWRFWSILRDRSSEPLYNPPRLARLLATGLLCGLHSTKLGYVYHSWGSQSAQADRLERAKQPVICAIQGFAYGGGLELALACDIRIVADSTRFAMPEVKLGTVPGWGGTDRLPRLIGSARAKQMIFTGEPIAADVAERWGLVNEVVPAASLSDRVTELAEKIAGNAPVAVQTAKQLIANPSLATLESLASAVNAFSDDAKEGLAAFREKRSPEFEGR